MKRTIQIPFYTVRCCTRSEFTCLVGLTIIPRNHKRYLNTGISSSLSPFFPTLPFASNQRVFFFFRVLRYLLLKFSSKASILIMIQLNDLMNSMYAIVSLIFFLFIAYCFSILKETVSLLYLVSSKHIRFSTFLGKI